MRIRLEEDGIDKFKVVLPGKNKDFPIGVIWKDPFRGKIWKTKPYFATYDKITYVEQKTYDDFMKAARALALQFERNNVMISFQEEEDYGLVWPDATD